jgi:hypothetical protein
MASRPESPGQESRTATAATHRQARSPLLGTRARKASSTVAAPSWAITVPDCGPPHRRAEPGRRVAAGTPPHLLSPEPRLRGAVGRASGENLPVASGQAARVLACSHRSAKRCPASKARTIGAQPSACTLTIRGRRVRDEANGFQLGECLPHAHQPCPAASGVHDHVGQFPLEVFGKLETERLLPLPGRVPSTY